MTVVVTDRADYRIAVAELPRSTRLGDSAAGAVVVVTADRGAILAAAQGGAAAIVVADPNRALPEVGAPVVLDRALLRPDLVAEATSGAGVPALVQVEASAARAELAATLRDALGWARVLAGGPLRLDTRLAVPDGVSAVFEATTPSGDRVPIVLTVTHRTGSSPWIRALAIGPDRCEVTLDVARGLARVERATEGGRTRPAPRWESRERLALRRALAAIGGVAGDDRADWARDDALATALAHPALG